MSFAANPSRVPISLAGTEALGTQTKFYQGLPTAVYTTDAGGRITFYNEAARLSFGGCARSLAERIFWIVETLLV